MTITTDYIHEYLEQSDGTYKENGFWKIVKQNGKTLTLENRFGGIHEHDINSKDVLYLNTTYEKLEQLEKENNFVLDKSTNEKVYVEFGNHYMGVLYLLFKALNKMFPEETYYKECLNDIKFIPCQNVLEKHVDIADKYFEKNIEISGANYGNWYYSPKNIRR